MQKAIRAAAIHRTAVKVLKAVRAASKLKRATIKAVKAVKASVIHRAATKVLRAAASAVTAPPR